MHGQGNGGTVSETKGSALLGSGQTARAWEITGDLRAAAGYKDNVLLSSVRTEPSAFVLTETELYWWWNPTDRIEALASIDATLTHFLDSTENPREGQAFAHAQIRWMATPTLRATGEIEAYYMDQVFDLSETDAERVTAKLRVMGAWISPRLRWEFLPLTWLDFKPAAQRDRYQDGSDDNDQITGRVALGHGFGERVELTVAAERLVPRLRQSPPIYDGRPAGHRDKTAV